MKKGIILAALAMTTLAGCDKVTKDIDVDNVKFEFTAVTENVANRSGLTIKSSGTTTSFSVTRKVDLSEFSTAEIVDYLDKINKVAVNNPVLKITMNPPGAYEITNFTLTAEGVKGSLDIASYKIGDEFVPPSGMKKFTSDFIMKLISEKSLSVTVSGETNAPAGTTVKISYESDLVVTVDLL